MTADSLLLMSGWVAEAAAFLLLLYRRVYRTLPIFCLYIAWSLLTDSVQPAAERHYPASALLIFTVSLAIDSLFQFGVLIELSRSVLRPVAQFLPRWTSVAVGALIILICAAIWPFAKSQVFGQFTPQAQLLVHLQQTFAILRILFFLVLAGCSQLLSIGWRDRELQVATGLGFYSMASITVSVLHTRQEFYQDYHLMDQLVAASYVCTLLYWVFCFVQQEAARREFTPQMQNFLLALAGNARTTRMALSDSETRKDQDHRL